MKTQVNSLKISSFPKILSLKSFGNLGSNLYGTSEYRRKRRVNKSVKYIVLIEDASDTYVFCNNYLKYLFVKFLSIFSSFQCFCMVRFERGIVLSSSYDG